MGNTPSTVATPSLLMRYYSTRVIACQRNLTLTEIKSSVSYRLFQNKKDDDMKHWLPIAATCAIITTTAVADTTQNNLSYAIGYKTGQALQKESVAINTEQFSSGLVAGYQGNPPTVSSTDMQTALTTMQQQMADTMKEKFEALAQKNETTGKTFLADNAKKPGVVTTASGLEYKVLDAGQGNGPAITDTVTVNYEGTLIDGTVFDSSYKRGQPATFQVGGVIKGWQEALQLMKPGATWMLYIPANLAYGNRGSAGAIGPNETLIFKVNLMSVNNKG